VRVECGELFSHHPCSTEGLGVMPPPSHSDWHFLPSAGTNMMMHTAVVAYGCMDSPSPGPRVLLLAGSCHSARACAKSPAR
jgi:hypothetical protein